VFRNWLTRQFCTSSGRWSVAGHITRPASSTSEKPVCHLELFLKIYTSIYRHLRQGWSSWFCLWRWWCCPVFSQSQLKEERCCACAKRNSRVARQVRSTVATSKLAPSAVGGLGRFVRFIATVAWRSAILIIGSACVEWAFRSTADET